MLNEVSVCKIFTFDAAHQLVGHKGKCSNLHGHTYKLEVVLKGKPMKRGRNCTRMKASSLILAISK